ncbi:MAG TPA: hypothetical protein VHE99_03935 [Gammaproteobacteria bacterium]|nr:hypothetical protein [Gammaproteobacteria bacterium]
MFANKLETIQELQWHEVRHEVAKTNSTLAKIIDELDPSPEYTLFKVKYHFGSEILKNGYLYIPNANNELVPLSSTPAKIQDKLSYNNFTNPVSLVLNNAVEFFLVVGENTIPLYGLIRPGKIFGTWRILNPQETHSPAFIWDMTAGARSIFMLPKIAESAKYSKLQRTFQLRSEKPTSLLDHWNIFKGMANHPEFGESWSVDVLFFTKKWFECLNDKEWNDLKVYLLEVAWKSSEFFRNQFMWNLAFSLIQKEYNLKPNPYTVDIVKHLLAMGIGAMPGFASALDDSAAPIRRLQEFFVTIYQLNEYAPIIMQPQFFSLENPRSIYYSLQYPTTIEFSPKSRESSTKIFDLYQIKSLLSRYFSEIRLDRLNLKGTPIYELLDSVKFDFFHTDPENYSGIRLSKEIPVEDPTFFEQLIDGASRNFPVNSPFIRGCVRIAAK